MLRKLQFQSVWKLKNRMCLHLSHSFLKSWSTLASSSSQRLSAATLSETLSPEALKLSYSHKTATGQEKETLTASILIHFQLLVCVYGFASVSDWRSISQRRGEEEEGSGSILIIKQVSWMNILCRMAAAVFVLCTNWWTNACSRCTSFIFTGCLLSQCCSYLNLN